MAEFIHAQWWQPAEPAKKLPGVLFQDENQAWMLHLDGSFDEISSSASGGQPMPISLQDGFPILLGITSTHQLITAFGCDTERGYLPSGSLDLRPTVLAHGVHFDDESDFRLVSLAVQFSNLDTWADTSGFTIVDRSAFSTPVKIEYSLPGQVEAELPDGISVGIAFRVNGIPLRPAFEMHMVQRAWVTVRAKTARRYEDMLRISNSLADFIGLAVGEPLRRLEVTGTCNARVGQTNELRAFPFDIVDNRNPIVTERREVGVREMLFTLNDIRSRFADVVQAWFTKSEHISPLYNLYFGSLRSPFMYVEHRFLNMFQALEAYDRRTRVTSAAKVQDHEARLGRITEVVNAANPEDADWLKGKLRHSIEPNAEQRIRELTKQHRAEWLLNSEDIRLAADLRNFNTHFSPEVEKRLPPQEERSLRMHVLAVRLQVLCEMILLSLVGISDVREKIDRVKRLERRGAG